MIIGNSITQSSSGLIRPYIVYNYEGNYLDSVTVKGDTILPGYAFNGASRLYSIDLSDARVFAIGQACFSGCSNLALSSLPQELTELGDSSTTQGAFSQGTFYSCEKITINSVPGGVKIIPFACFYRCKQITSILVNEGTTNLYSNCFSSCTRLQNADLPSTLTKLAGSVFSGDSALTTITCRAIAPPTMLSSSGFGTVSALAHIYVPSVSVDAYKSATNWSQYASIISAIPT